MKLPQKIKRKAQPKTQRPLPRGQGKKKRDYPSPGDVPSMGARKLLLEKESLVSQIVSWFLPVGFFLGSAILFYFLHAFWDFNWDQPQPRFFETILTTDAAHVNDAIGSFIELLAAVLGLVITVVAIVLQLAAQRYGNRLIDLFLENKVNQTYFFFMVTTLLYAIFIIFAIKNDFYPNYAIRSLLALTVVEIACLPPYFLYVFKILTPTNLLSSIQENSRVSVRSGTDRKNYSNLKKYQREVATAIEQVTDTALSANSQMDRNLGLMAINQIREMLLDYLQYKKQLPRGWFLASDDFFIGISSEFFHEICQKRLWVETKSLMDMELIYKSCIRNMPDAISAIAYNTRVIGEEAIKDQDDDLVEIIVQFFNTFLRISLNDGNQRAMFNLFYQYRLFANTLMDYSPKQAAKIFFYFKYYGEQGLMKGIWFILYNAAFDLGGMVATAYDKKMKNIKDLLFIFMQLEDTVDKKKDWLALMGVRKSQLILAAYLFSKGEETLVRIVVEDLKNESFDNLIKWRDMLLSLKDKKFWEITDRGINFEYIDEEQKKSLELFYKTYILSQPQAFSTN
ncbi:MAG: hypothetical protein COB67_08390 [SAR324 cluster bacterium]|uniref:DUF2254 domain-containing protein n=1 Tax=SAR324 cluster bacterium TaxID=2024889 RepID=A0A2A4T1M5_9DELT|nr:MAG: hypothetical protein COB67_08390 [SAR324 cluster bacterium]